MKVSKAVSDSEMEGSMEVRWGHGLAKGRWLVFVAALVW